MKRTLSALTLLGLLTLPALSGCGNTDTPPAQADPTTSSPSTTVSSVASGPTAPAMPAATHTNTRAGAIAFARYFWDVVNYAQATLDTRLLKTLGSRSCRGCQGGVRWIDGIAASHGSIRGGRNTVRHVGIPSPARRGHPDWDVSLEIVSSGQVVTQPGKPPKRYDRGVNHVSMTLRMEDGSWKVEFLEYQ